MGKSLIRTIKQRRDDVYRRMEDLRSELANLRARADELDRILKEAIQGEERIDNASSSNRNIEVVTRRKTISHGVPALLLEAIEMLDTPNNEGAPRGSILHYVYGKAPHLKPNTVRVALLRLVRDEQVKKSGDYYRVPASGKKPKRVRATEDESVARMVGRSRPSR